MEIKDKVFVVTGSGNGIGRELALGLVSRGACVAAVDMNQAALTETKKLSGEMEYRIVPFVVDITDQDAVESLPDRINARFGSVDGIINNAGVIQPFLSLSEIGYEAIRKVFDVNFYGTLYMIKAFLPYLRERPQAHITNISSMGGLFAVPGQNIYGASKAAVKLLTEGLWSELKDTHIRVMLVFPGGINSNIMDNSGVVLSRKMKKLQQVVKLTSPKKAAGIIVKGIERNRYRLPVGVDAAVLDFICRMGPGRSERWLYRLMKMVLYD